MFRTFQFLGQTIHLFNLFLGLAMSVGALQLQRTYQHFGIPLSIENKYNLATALAILTGMLGGMVFESIFQGTELSFSYFMNSYQGGFTFYGGVIAGGITCVILSILLHFNSLYFFNLAAPSLTIAHAIGRLGCFFAGCCFGRPTQWPLGVIYPKGSLPAVAFGQRPLHPTQLYESCFLFLLFAFLNKINLRYRAWVYCIGYGIVRFIIEFLRADARGSISNPFDLSPAQLISIFLIGVGGFLVFYQAVKHLFSKLF